MSVSEDDVRRIAALARIRPDEASVGRLTEDLNGILDHIRVLERLDLAAVVTPGVETADAVQPRDSDLPPDPMTGNEPADFAPEWKDGFFLVPRLPALGGDGAEEVADG